MDDDKDPSRSEPESEIGQDQGKSAKIVPLRPDAPLKAPEPLDPRLEELRRILNEAPPIDNHFSDDEVIADEAKFRRRFGPGFHWNRRDRIGLIALKKRYDLTDRDIQLFHYTGNLGRTLLGVRLTASPWIALWGGVQIAVFGMLFVALLLAAWPKLATPLQAMKPALALTGLFVFCVALFCFYVLPWVVQRRVHGASVKTSD